MTFLFFLLMACGTTTIDLVEDCDVLASEVVPSEAAPGAEVAVVLTPVTTNWDTAVYVDGVRAEVVDIRRDGCEECDTCKEEEACLACSDCDTCDAVCKSDCIESVVFVVPARPPGAANVVVYNGSGASNPVTLNITVPSDTGDPDTGAPSGDSGGPVDTAGLSLTK